MSEIKLLPCPFCGREKMEIFEDLGVTMIACTQCHAMMEAGTKEEAINQWNTRKPMERIVKKIKERQQIHKDIYDKNEEELEWIVSNIASYERIEAVQGSVIDAYDYSLAVIKEEGEIK